MKRTLWLLLLLPAVLISAWASQVGRPGPDHLFEADYIIVLHDSITTGQLFPVSPDLTAQPETLTPQDILSRQDVHFPEGASFYIYEPSPIPPRLETTLVLGSSELHPGVELGQKICITLTNTASNHHRFYQYLQHTLQPHQPESIATRSPIKPGVLCLPQIQGLYFGIGEYMEISFDESENAQIRPQTVIHYGTLVTFAIPWSNYPSKFPLLWQCQIRKTYIGYTGPAWPLIFVLLSLPAIFLYVLRRPLIRMLRLPLARKSPQPVELPASSET